MILENRFIKYIAIICLLFISACKQAVNEYTVISGFTQGTTYHIKYKSPNYELYDKDIEDLLHNFDLSLSTYIDSSAVSKWNNNIDTSANNDLLLQVVSKSLEIYRLTNGAFDITVAPLIDLWGFYKDSIPDVDSSQVFEILKTIGSDKIEIRNNRIIKTIPQLKIDLNAIAQGYSVDIVGDFLNKKGVDNWMVEIGGELKTKGVNDKGVPWVIGIDKPTDKNNIAGSMGLEEKIGISNIALATSGNYRNFYVKDGRKYSHTINPKTGFPVQHNLLSASIIAEDCMTADAIATACMVLGLEKSKLLIDSLNNIEAFLIFENDNHELRHYSTEGFDKFILK